MSYSLCFRECYCIISIIRSPSNLLGLLEHAHKEIMALCNVRNYSSMTQHHTAEDINVEECYSDNIKSLKKGQNY